MTPFETWKPGTPPAALSEALFGGALVVFEGQASISAVANRARDLVEAVFGTDAPERAESVLDAETFRNAVRTARRAVAADKTIADAWRHTLSEIGYAPETTFGDRLRLRIVPSNKTVRSANATPLDAHRDNWGSGIAAQINWWLPLYPLSASRTILLWPALFEQEVANTSAEWDFEAMRAAHRAGTPYPRLPVAVQSPDETDAVPVLLQPGKLLAFSAAHLHASRADASGTTRFSLDTRTYWQADIDGDRGAVNTDGASRPPQWSWFECIGAGTDD